jgi:hypothetical protein
MKAKSRQEAEAELLEKIASMPSPFRAMGERLHALILRSAPALQPTTWYGMPAYAKDGNAICFFRADKKYIDVRLHPGRKPRPRERRAAPAHRMRVALYRAGQRDRGQALRTRPPAHWLSRP